MSTSRGVSSLSPTLGGDEGPIQCKECGRRFARTANLRRHVASLHEQAAKYVCQVCHRSFFRKDQYLQHRRHHEGNTFQCDMCPRRFSHKQSLVRHQRQRHRRPNRTGDSTTAAALPSASTLGTTTSATATMSRSTPYHVLGFPGFDFGSPSDPVQPQIDPSSFDEFSLANVLHSFVNSDTISSPQVGPDLLTSESPLWPSLGDVMQPTEPKRTALHRSAPMGSQNTPNASRPIYGHAPDLMRLRAGLSSLVTEVGAAASDRKVVPPGLPDHLMTMYAGDQAPGVGALRMPTTEATGPASFAPSAPPSGLNAPMPVTQALYRSLDGQNVQLPSLPSNWQTDQNAGTADFRMTDTQAQPQLPPNPLAAPKSLFGVGSDSSRARLASLSQPGLPDLQSPRGERSTGSSSWSGLSGSASSMSSSSTSQPHLHRTWVKGLAPQQHAHSSRLPASASSDWSTQLETDHHDGQTWSPSLPVCLPQPPTAAGWSPPPTTPPLSASVTKKEYESLLAQLLQVGGPALVERVRAQPFEVLVEILNSVQKSMVNIKSSQPLSGSEVMMPVNSTTQDVSAGPYYTS